MNVETVLFSQGFGSRRQCRALILAGAVRIAGARCLDPMQIVTPESLEWEIDGQRWCYREKAYLLLNKPAGYECSREPQHHASVFSLLPAPLFTRGVQCVGRLDQDTTGLLLLSDDGRFVHALASPKRKVTKVYRAGVKHPLTPAQIDALLAGVSLHGEAAPSIAVSARALEAHLLELTITEGKYHQVKRMVAAVGNRVETLHREAIGGLVLPAALAPGQWCWLDAEERDRLLPQR